ncbi:MAG: hypothetical protein SWY16_25055 [Cyanobacteriota bacterium]|nr:hypothetical protein [Cyanobacteriota bacterium]
MHDVPSQSPRLVYLDNLRVLLTILVIAHHSSLAYGPHGGDWPVSDTAIVLGLTKKMYEERSPVPIFEFSILDILESFSIIERQFWIRLFPVRVENG